MFSWEAVANGVCAIVRRAGPPVKGRRLNGAIAAGIVGGMATRPFLVPPGPLSRETAAALTDLAGLFAAFYGRLSLGQGLEGAFGRDGIRLALNPQAMTQGPWLFQGTTIDFIGDVVTFDTTTTVEFDGETLFAFLSCFAAFDDTLSASSTNNWAGVTATWAWQPWVRLAGNGGTDCGLTGVVAPPGTDEGCSFWLLYTGPGTLHLTHQDAASTAANRVITPTGKDWLLRAGQCVQLRYDRAVSRWRVLSGESDFTGATSLADGAPGLVPKPLIADRTLYLDGSGDWSTPAGSAAVVVRKNSGGADVGPRRRLNLVEGVGVVVTVADDAVNDEVDVTVAAGVTVKVGGGADVGTRRAVNFVANDPITVTAADNAGSNRVDVTVGVQNAGPTQTGVMTTGTQTIAGAKTFTGAMTLSGGVTGNVSGGSTASVTGFGSVSVANGITVNGFAGANTTFATGDGRTATVTGGIITDVS